MTNGEIGEIDDPFADGSRLYNHCVSLYNLMEKRSQETSDAKLFLGSISQILRDELDLATSYQSTITNRLRDMGCITMLRRGGGQGKSVWQLFGPPTFEVFLSTAGVTKDEDLEKTRTDEVVALAQRVNDLNTRVLNLENVLGEHIRSHQ